MGDIAYGRIAFLVGAGAISAYLAWHFGDNLRLSENLSGFIGIMFSILAASLFVVMSIVGDPSMILPGNWRVAWESAKSIQSDLQRFSLLFVWYLLTLGLWVVAETIKAGSHDSYYFVYNVFAFFSCFGFIVSLALPFSLAAIQRERLNQEIASRRNGA